MRRELAYLDDILECIAKVEGYLAGVDEAAFQANQLLQDGVTRNLEIIGEAAKSLPGEVRQRQSQI
ncbi:MAG: HepT-like ribonuclease domain-containing protein, partial [Blastocatellia bacterium]